MGVKNQPSRFQKSSSIKLSHKTDTITIEGVRTNNSTIQINKLTNHNLHPNWPTELEDKKSNQNFSLLCIKKKLDGRTIVYDSVEEVPDNPGPEKGVYRKTQIDI